MSDPYNLQRFVDAQANVFETALAELRGGSKQSHWMWFVFPQLAGLGRSPTARYYSVSSLAEARAFLAHPLLGPRLRKSVDGLLSWSGRRSAEQILGSVDSLKLRSSLTLFDRIEPNGPFAAALEAFFAGRPDDRTLATLNCKR